MEIYTPKRRSPAAILHFGNNEFRGTGSCHLTLVDGVLKDREGDAIQMRDLEDIVFDKKDLIEISPDQHEKARTFCMSSLMGQHLVQQFNIAHEQVATRGDQSFARRVDQHWLVCKQQPPNVFYQKVPCSCMCIDIGCYIMLIPMFLCPFMLVARQKRKQAAMHTCDRSL